MAESWFTTVAHLVLQLIQPIALVWLGLIGLTIVLWRSRQRGAAIGAAMLLSFVQVIGGTPLPVWLLARLERPFVGSKPEDLPVCDAIVLLGGGIVPSPHEVGNLHLSNAGDRIVMALELARLGKAPVLCVSGAKANPKRPEWVEADLLQRALDERQMAAVPVISLGGSTDTHDEAVRLRPLAAARGWKRLLLVTSAAHQRRALATFRTAGFDVVAAPCNFVTMVGPEAAPANFEIPSITGFGVAAIWLHEEIGWLEYRRRGWIDAR